MITIECKTHKVRLVWNAEKREKKLDWTYGENPACCLFMLKVEEIEQAESGKRGECELWVRKE